MSVGVNTNRNMVFGKQAEIFPVRVKVMQRLVASVCIQFKGNVMHIKGGGYHPVQKGNVTVRAEAVYSHKVSVADYIKKAR